MKQALFLVVLSASALPNQAALAGSNDGWELLKRELPGTWTLDAKKSSFRVEYRIIANGSALIEDWGVGSAHETATVFHPDKTDLLLTHYCAQGNQPRLKAASVTAKEIVFRFVDVTNKAPEQAMLIERTLHFNANAFDDTETYLGADGQKDTTVYHFTRLAN